MTKLYDVLMEAVALIKNQPDMPYNQYHSTTATIDGVDYDITEFRSRGKGENEVTVRPDSDQATGSYHLIDGKFIRKHYNKEEPDPMVELPNVEVKRYWFKHWWRFIRQSSQFQPKDWKMPPRGSPSPEERERPQPIWRWISGEYFGTLWAFEHWVVRTLFRAHGHGELTVEALNLQDPDSRWVELAEGINVDFGRAVDSMMQKMMLPSEPPPLLEKLAKMCGWKLPEGVEPNEDDQVDQVNFIAEFCQSALGNGEVDDTVWEDLLGVYYDSPYYERICQIRFQDTQIFFGEACHSAGPLAKYVMDNIDDVLSSLSKEDVVKFKNAVQQYARKRAKQTW